MPHPPQIPLTPQTDERNFPRWDKNAPAGKSGHPYPKMLTKICTREDRDAWVEKNRRTDRVTREDYWEETPPRVGAPIPIPATQELVDEGLSEIVNAPVVVNDATAEQRACELLGLAPPQTPPKKVAIPLAVPLEDYEPATKVVERKKRGRPAKQHAKSEVVEELD